MKLLLQTALLCLCLIIAVLGDQNVIVDDTSSLISYSGTWSTSNGPLAYDGGHHYSQDPNGKATFTFTGTALYYMAPLWPYAVTTELTLDGGSSVVVNLQASNTGTVGDGETVASAILYSFTGLSNTQHTLVATMAPGGSFIVIDALIYTVPDTVTTTTTQSPNVAPPATTTTTTAAATVTITVTTQSPNVAPPATTPATPAIITVTAQSQNLAPAATTASTDGGSGGSSGDSQNNLFSLLECTPCGSGHCVFTDPVTMNNSVYALIVGTVVTNCDSNDGTSVTSASGGSITLTQTWSEGGTVGLNLGGLKLDSTFGWSQATAQTFTQTITITVPAGQQGALVAYVEYSRVGGTVNINDDTAELFVVSNQPTRVTNYAPVIVPCSQQFSANISSPFNCTGNSGATTSVSPSSQGLDALATCYDLSRLDTFLALVSCIIMYIAY